MKMNQATLSLDNSPVKHRMPRLDSLFARLLVSQVALVLALALVVGVLFQMERNITLATLYAERWAPALAGAAGLPVPPQALAAVPVLRSAVEPPGARRPSRRTPRFAALRRELAAQGLPVDDLMLSLDEPQPVVWLHVTPPGQPAQWLGVAGQLVASEWPLRALVVLLVSSALLVAVSWGFTRRLTRPLERLRARMQSHTPGDAAAAAGPMSGVAPEIAAIDAAYSDLLARLQQHERERAVLLAGVSHDLRSPLGRIRMAAELLPDGADVRVRKDTIVRNVAAADRLIESFLDYVRSGELPFDETVDLAAAARAVVAGFDRPEAELSLVAPESLPWPCANRLLVERLLANLVDNALKHGRPPVRLALHVDEQERQAWIDVEDAGEGLDPQQFEQMQEAFTRGDGSRHSPGSGLGLAIVRQVAARLGGELSLERDDGMQRVRITLWATRSRPE
jgi:two-component system osmolarity sensor histidine kinase EnvZ